MFCKRFKDKCHLSGIDWVVLGRFQSHPDLREFDYATTLPVASTNSAFWLLGPLPGTQAPLRPCAYKSIFGQSLVSAPHYFVLSPIKAPGPQSKPTPAFVLKGGGVWRSACVCYIWHMSVPNLSFIQHKTHGIACSPDVTI